MHTRAGKRQAAAAATLPLPPLLPLLLCLPLLLLPRPLSAQPAQPASPPAAAPDAGSAAPAEKPPAVPPQDQKGEEDLLRQTLAMDIRTAGYYELLAWCRRLGLEDTGSRVDLQNRLLAHYRLPPPEPEAGDSEARNLQIESARESEYFSIEQVDQQYVVLRGGVHIELREGDTLHTIRAERVTLNETQNILTAEGGVEYSMVQGKRTENFRGDSLTFNTRTLEGVFFEGGAETEQQVQNKPIRFRFVGSTITRLENNTVVLEKARITSSQPADDPYYHIRARKVWVLASGEWAVRDAWLYVGRVPMVYLPFFFYPGDEFLFHPVIGNRDREGSFLQTTTYLLGQKKRSRTPLSILSLEGQDDQQLRRRREGMFLTEVPGQMIAAEDLDRFLILMFDVYSRLGLFAGVSGNFPPAVHFRGGIGFSRSIFQLGGVYTPYWPDPSGAYRSFWNESTLLGMSLPFRYGLDASWQLGTERFQLSGKFEGYSDPFFPTDFFDRAEELNWSAILGLEGGSGLQAPLTERLNLTWELTAKADFAQAISSPYFQSVSIPYLQARMFWQSRVLAGLASDPVLAADPARRFYYPVSLQFPNLSVNLSGELLRFSTGGDNRGAAASPAGPKTGTGPPRPEGDYQPPEPLDPRGDGAGPMPPASRDKAGATPTGGADEVAAGDSADRSAEEDASIFRLPGPREDLPLADTGQAFSFRLGYQMRPDLLVEQLYDSAGWNTPSAIDYDVLYTTLRVTDTAGLNYELSALRNLVGATGGLSLTTSYRHRYRGVAPLDPAWQNLVLGDYQQSRADLSSLLNLSLHPLIGLPGWERSTLSYALNWILFSYQLQEGSTYLDPLYRGRGLDWSLSTVRSHRAQATLEYRPNDVSHTLSLTADLPPFPAVLSGRLQFTVWLLTTTVNTVLRQDGGRWDLQPLVVLETLNLSDRIQFSEEARFDLEEGLFLKSISTLKLGGWSASLSAERLPPVFFNGTDWQPTGEPERVQLTQLKVGYNLAPKPIYFWRNRIWMEPKVDTSWTMNLMQSTENSLDFVFGFRFFIYQFLELSFTTASSNNRTYRWFPALARQTGMTPVNPFLDLLRSFNFFNTEDRRISDFKLRSISVQAVHHLRDWDLTVTYDGKPTLFTNPAGLLQYRWENTLIILLQWVPLPEVRSRAWLDTTGFYVRS